MILNCYYYLELPCSYIYVVHHGIHEILFILLQLSGIPGLSNAKEEDYERTPMCVFWDPTLDGGFGDWSSSGCKLVGEVRAKARCECDHLTSFALLMVGVCVCKCV